MDREGESWTLSVFVHERDSVREKVVQRETLRICEIDMNTHSDRLQE